MKDVEIETIDPSQQYETKTQQNEYKCIHEDQIQQHTQDLTKLKTRIDYKHEQIDEIKNEMKEINTKIDKLSNNLNKYLLQSITDDKDIDKRVTSLESTVQVLKYITTLLFGSGVIWIILNIIK